MSENARELKEFVDFVFDCPEFYKRVMADGKVNLLDLPIAPAIFKSANDGLGGLGNPIARMKALTADEKVLAYAHVKERFDITNDEIEDLVERWFDAVILVATLSLDTLRYFKAS